MSVVVETTIGDMTIDLMVHDRPKSSFNFMKLCKTKYYNCCIFHRIEKDFIAQTGDPTGSGSGGSSIFQQIKGSADFRFFEREAKPRITHEHVGTVSFVDNGDGMHGSQFFITLGSDLDFLDDKHTVFGHVVEGLDVVQKLNSEIADSDHKPYRDIRITHTVILHDPFEDPAGLFVPPASPEIPDFVFESDRIGIEEAIDETAGKPLEVIEETLMEKEAKARATILEMIGDLPDADMAPPENVLFVCKLNPVTREEDLEIIFSRFGEIKSCEVIKDQRSGESLQYAFIEFANRQDCEKAYFKMDNVLIDDRRIHVDFSQSVAKYKWKGKGKGVIVQRDEDDGERNRTPHHRSNNYREERNNSERRSHQRRDDEDHHRKRRRSSSSDRKRSRDDSRHRSSGDRHRDRDRDSRHSHHRSRHSPHRSHRH
jgi:peptidyl-prolyl cis-trans isomerase-like 4